MSTALGLHLVLDVHARDAGPDILPHCAGDIGRSTKAAWPVRQKKRGEGDSLPCIGVRNDRNRGLQAANHLRSLRSIVSWKGTAIWRKISYSDEVVQGCNSDIRLAQPRGGSGSSAVENSKRPHNIVLVMLLTSGTSSQIRPPKRLER